VRQNKLPVLRTRIADPDFGYHYGSVFW
jgi:hypothetical protein